MATRAEIAHRRGMIDHRQCSECDSWFYRIKEGKTSKIPGVKRHFVKTCSRKCSLARTDRTHDEYDKSDAGIKWKKDYMKKNRKNPEWMERHRARMRDNYARHIDDKRSKQRDYSKTSKPKETLKRYRQRPEVIARIKIEQKNYYQKNRERILNDLKEKRLSLKAEKATGEQDG